MPLPFAVAVKPEFIKPDTTSESTKALNFYEIIKILTSKKNIEALNDMSQGSNTMFMVNRIFSADKKLINLSYAMSVRYDMPVENALLFYLYTIPSRKSYRTLYNNNKNKVLDAQIDLVQKFFECNKMKAEEYLRILNPADLDEIGNIIKKTVEYENEE